MVILFLLVSISMGTDNYQWLENIEDSKSIDFVTKSNEVVEQKYQGSPIYKSIYDKIFERLNSKEKLVNVSIHGNYVYNIWNDEQHTLGLWRRMKLEHFRSRKNHWENLLDLDALSKIENKKLTLKNYDCLKPALKKCLLTISNGGKDASEIREYNIEKKKFEGFFIPESKSSAFWIDENTLGIAYAKLNEDLTDSGYPRIIKRWKRNQKIDQAQTIIETDVQSMSMWGEKIDNRIILTKKKDFYTNLYYDYKNKTTRPIDIPEDAQIEGMVGKYLLVKLSSDWLRFSSGSLLSIHYSDLLRGKHKIQVIFNGEGNSFYQGMARIKDGILIHTLKDVKSELSYAHLIRNEWNVKKLDLPLEGMLTLEASDESRSHFVLRLENMINPPRQYVAHITASKKLELELIKSMPRAFDESQMIFKQFKAISLDKTVIPYFIVHSKKVEYNGANPTLLFGYGGFEISLLPNYDAKIGIGMQWPESNKIYVVANLRGGNEFGPNWHKGAVKENHIHAIEDFLAVAADLINRKITTPAKLAIHGRSNGGLLVSASMVMRPDLFKAVICGVPLTDMKRYHLLLAGASWMAEYGNPDIPQEWDYIKQYSPYQNLKNAIQYPSTLFYTSTKDDRVHPGHARKMYAKMKDFEQDVYLFENREGGHAGSLGANELAKVQATIFSFFHELTL